jgi:predicted nucleotidyltransferase
LSEHILFDELILFGSYAKGTSCTDSDMDVVVVVDSLQGDYFMIRPLL